MRYTSKIQFLFRNIERCWASFWANITIEWSLLVQKFYLGRKCVNVGIRLKNFFPFFIQVVSVLAPKDREDLAKMQFLSHIRISETRGINGTGNKYHPFPWRFQILMEKYIQEKNISFSNDTDKSKGKIFFEIIYCPLCNRIQPDHLNWWFILAGGTKGQCMISIFLLPCFYLTTINPRLEVDIVLFRFKIS